MNYKEIIQFKETVNKCYTDVINSPFDDENHKKVRGLLFRGSEEIEKYINDLSWKYSSERCENCHYTESINGAEELKDEKERIYGFYYDAKNKYENKHRQWVGMRCIPVIPKYNENTDEKDRKEYVEWIILWSKWAKADFDWNCARLDAWVSPKEKPIYTGECYQNPNPWKGLGPSLDELGHFCGLF